MNHCLYDSVYISLCIQTILILLPRMVLASTREQPADWCCFYYFVRNSLVALLEALCARKRYRVDFFVLLEAVTQLARQVHRPTQSIMYVPLQVNRFQTNFLNFEINFKLCFYKKWDHGTCIKSLQEAGVKCCGEEGWCVLVTRRSGAGSHHCRNMV